MMQNQKQETLSFPVEALLLHNKKAAGLNAFLQLYYLL